jgi:small subunit ribosomal protein S18
MNSYIKKLKAKKKSHLSVKKLKVKKKPCYLHIQEMTYVDYKNIELIGKFINSRGEILPARMTGTCAKHQRLVARAIKRARIVSLIPYSVVRER